MSVFANEAALYWGNSTTPITNLSGASGRGIPLANVQQKRVVFTPDNPAIVTIELRDVDPTSLRLAARDFMANTDTGVRASGSSIRKPYLSGYSFQFAAVPLLSTDHMLYLPCAMLLGGGRVMRHGLEPDEIEVLRVQAGNPELLWQWGRDGEHHTGTLTLIATRAPGQTTPAWVKDTPAVVASVYSLAA